MFNFFSSFENVTVYDIMWKKYSKAGQATDDNQMQAHFMLGT